MLPTFCRDTVTRLRPTMTESRGKEVPDWTNPDKRVIHGCSMQPASTSLSTDGRILGISDYYTLFTPSDADIKTGDRISYRGDVYEIVGDVRVTPTACRLDHIEISLRRYSG